VLLPIAFGIALAAAVLLLVHVARRYASAPKRVPIAIRYDGRPGRDAPRAILWLAPSILTLTVLTLGAALLVGRPRPEQTVVLALVFITMAEVAWLVGWVADRQIELARKMTFRIAPNRLILVILPLLATCVAIIVAAGLTS
jgi:hypothetical protein